MSKVSRAEKKIAASFLPGRLKKVQIGRNRDI